VRGQLQWYHLPFDSASDGGGGAGEGASGGVAKEIVKVFVFQVKRQSGNGGNKELICFESVELELGLSTTTEDNCYTCPIFLHKDESRTGRYFATHSAGIHSVTISCLKDLQSFVSGNNGDCVKKDFDFSQV
jgi:hypothetical protein